jgi:glutamine synthetase
MFGYSLLRTTQNQRFYEDAYDLLHKFNVDVEGWHTETGPGVFEAALAYDTAMEAADIAFLFKTSIKQLALKNGFIASFMAKPWNDLPGCSGHIHFSLKDETGQNVFVGESTDEHGMSSLMRHFIAGILIGLPSILAILAPTINRYELVYLYAIAYIGVSYSLEAINVLLEITGRL